MRHATWFSPIDIDFQKRIEEPQPKVVIGEERDPKLIAIRALNIAMQRKRGEFSLADLFDPDEWKTLSGVVRTKIGRYFIKLLPENVDIPAKHGTLRKSERFSTHSRNYYEID